MDLLTISSTSRIRWCIEYRAASAHLIDTIPYFSHFSMNNEIIAMDSFVAMKGDIIDKKEHLPDITFEVLPV